MTRVSLTISIALIATALLHGQSSLARLGGTISDPSTKAVPGARIQVKSTETGSLRTATTDNSGLFEIPGLTPGE